MADVIEIFADGRTIERDFTKEEIQQIEADKLAEIKRLEKLEAKAKAKAELLDRLGITADEAKLLLS